VSAEVGSVSVQMVASDPCIVTIIERYGMGLWTQERRSSCMAGRGMGVYSGKCIITLSMYLDISIAACEGSVAEVVCRLLYGPYMTGDFLHGITALSDLLQKATPSSSRIGTSRLS
jgi:hypothetical protein